MVGNKECINLLFIIRALEGISRHLGKMLSFTPQMYA